MPFAILLIGAVVVIVAINNTHGDLATALEKDLPGYFKWAIAIAVLLGLGYIPALKTPTRWLAALAAGAYILANYQTFITGLQSFASGGAAATAQGAAPPDPTSAYVQSGGATTSPPSQVAISGGAGSSNNAATGTMVASAGGSLFNPASLLSEFSSPSIGFGGLA